MNIDGCSFIKLLYVHPNRSVDNIVLVIRYVDNIVLVIRYVRHPKLVAVSEVAVSVS